MTLAPPVSNTAYRRLFITFSRVFFFIIIINNFPAESDSSRHGSSHIMDIKEDPKKGSVS